MRVIAIYVKFIRENLLIYVNNSPCRYLGLVFLKGGREMEKLTIIKISRSDYSINPAASSCSHCGNCGGQTGCGAHCKGGKVAEKRESE